MKNTIWKMQYIENSCSYGQLAATSQKCACPCILCRVFRRNIKSPRWLSQPQYSPDLAPCNFWLFPMLKSPWKGKRFQTVNEIKENMMTQLMVIPTKVFAAFWAVGEMLGELCEVPSCLLWRGLRRHYPMYKVSCILFNKCLCFSHYMVGYFPDRPCINLSPWLYQSASKFEQIDWKLVSNKSDYLYTVSEH